MFMDDNARPHGARIVQHFLQQEAVWDFIGRKINQRNPKCKNIDELRTAILQEWQQFPKNGLGVLCEA
jgi:hypothetical protein